MIQIGSLISCLALSSTVFASATTTESTPNEDGSNEKLPVVYTVPLVGQMGTDIHEDLVAEIIEDVQEVQPDLIIFRINSQDIGTNKHIPTYDRKEAGKFKLAEYRNMAQDIHTKLGHIDQVVWIEDSVGISTLLCMAWEKLYMSEGARLYGLQNLHRMTQNWTDEDIREKMEEAMEGQGRGFFEMGGRGKYARVLGNAMIDPEAKLSANFVGREVIWLPHSDAMWMVDDSTEEVANFNDVSALDTMLIEDTVNSLGDLVFVLGYREYEHNTQGDEIAEKYTSRWRSNYEKCKTTYEDFQADRGLGTTGDQAKILMAKRRQLEEVVKIMKRYSAVERRMSDEYRISINNLEFEIATLKDQIRQLKDSQRGGSRGGSRGGRGSGLGGGRG
jgi:hypothetical protein